MKKELAKTLSAELKPYGNTDINALKDIIANDETRFNARKEVIKLIDERHKAFLYHIKDVSLSFDKLEALVIEYNKDKKNNDVKKKLETFQKIMCDALINQLSSKYSEEFKRLIAPTPANIIAQLIAEYPDNENIRMFDRFCSYLIDYCTARRTMYSSKNVPNSAGHRLITENFSLFVKNKNAYTKLSNSYPSIVETVSKNLPELSEWSSSFANTSDYMEKFSVQDGITKYNAIVGEFNKAINLHIQNNPDDKKSLKSLRMKTLRKQILFDSESLFQTVAKIYTPAELKSTIQTLWEDVLENGNVLERMIALLGKFDQFDMKGVFFKKNKVGIISKQLFDGEPLKIRTALKEKYGKKDMEKRNYFPFQDIFDSEPESDIQKFFRDLNGYLSEARISFATINSSDDIMSESTLEYVKNFMDNLNDFRRISEVIAITDESTADTEFYNSYVELSEKMFVIKRAYNTVKNFVCQRPKDISKKFPLTFEYPEFMKGWDFDKTIKNIYGVMMFIKDGRIYIGVSNKKDAPNYKNIRPVSAGEESFRMVLYKQFKPNIQFPNMFNKDAPEDINKIFKSKKDKKSYDRKDTLKVIDYYKRRFIEKYVKIYDFKFSETSDYKNINDFYDEVSKFTYRISFIDVPTSQIDEWIDNKNLFMFVVSTKDYALGAHGSKELFTMYLESLFSEDNLKNDIIRLNGNSSIVMRPRVIDNPYKHKAGSVLLNKRDNDGNPIPNEIYTRLVKYLNGNLAKEELSENEASFLDKISHQKKSYDIVKDRRYTEDKFIIHLPITINHGCTISDKDFNTEIRKKFIANPDAHIIGIDRGERHILYVNVMDRNGKTVFEESLNVLDGYDYQMKLTQLEKQRRNQQRNWKTAGQIAHLKEGYVGKAVYEVCRLMLKYNAIVVMESLNKKFTTSRSAAFGPAVYAQFQRALLNKLNYLVLKERSPMEKGGILNGYQLAYLPKEGIGDNPVQFGSVFFVPAGYTSKIDPVTGFTSLFDFSEYETSNEKASKFTSSFDSIRINEENIPEVQFTYPKFKTHVKWPERKWSCAIKGERILSRKNQKTGYWEYNTVDVREEFDKLFENHGKKLEPGTDIKALMTEIRKSDASIDKEFVKLMKTVMHMRNSNPETGEDYILSPALDKYGKTFDSRNKENSSLGRPTNGDSNGARNIALKGLMMLNNEKDSGKFKCIKNEEWFRNIQKFSE